MTRILLAAPYDRPWSTGQYLRHALTGLGHEVRIFDYRESPRPDRELQVLIDRHRPELILNFKAERLSPDRILEARDRGIVTALWTPDVHKDLPRWVTRLARAHDQYFTIARGMVPVFRRVGIESVEWLSQGFAPEFFVCPPLREADHRRYGADVVVIGNVHGTASYRVRQEMLARAARAGARVRWWGPKIPGRLCNIPLLAKRATWAWGRRFVWNAEYAKAIACSKIFLARDIHPEVEASPSSRIYSALGCGAFYLTWHMEGLEDLFRIDRELVVFHDLDEMEEKIRYYLPRERVRRRIAEAGRRRVHEQHTYRHRLRHLVSIAMASKVRPRPVTARGERVLDSRGGG